LSEQLHEAITTLESATAKPKSMADRETYTTSEAQDFRFALLRVVRFNIDPIALGHASEQRHY
jgi:hypothetical protein